jgi:hypothetical protein
MKANGGLYRENWLETSQSLFLFYAGRRMAILQQARNGYHHAALLTVNC